jgi:hypothetical protein
MSKSYHSRFSTMKRKRRRELSERRKMPKVRPAPQTDPPPRETETVLRDSEQISHASHLPKMPQRLGNTDPPKGKDARPVLLGNNLSLSEEEPCPCCQLVWK